MIYKKRLEFLTVCRTKQPRGFNMPWFDFALLYHFIILNDHKTKTKFKIKKKEPMHKNIFFLTVKDTPINIERK